MAGKQNRGQRLLDLAKRVAEGYATIPQVRAFMVFGSAADGVVDEASDLDTTAYCDDIPPREAREQAVRRMGGDPQACSFPKHGVSFDRVVLPDCEDDCCVVLERFAAVQAECVDARDKVIRFCRRLDPFHERVHGQADAEADQLLREAAEGLFWPSEDTLADIQSCLVLYDPDGLLARWKREIADFPADARKLAIEHRLFFSALWVNEDMPRALAAGDRMHFAILRARAVEHFVRLLYTLNRRYFRKPKWFARHLKDFRFKPANTSRRLNSLWAEAEENLVDQMIEFIRDLIASIRKGCPEAAIDRVANWFRTG